MSGHTPEPWYSVHAEHSGATPGREWSSEAGTWVYPKGSAVENVIIECGREELSRADVCVNACQGMTDPAAEIAALQRAVEVLGRDFVRLFREQVRPFGKPEEWASREVIDNPIAAKAVREASK